MNKLSIHAQKNKNLSYSNESHHEGNSEKNFVYSNRNPNDEFLFNAAFSDYNLKDYPDASLGYNLSSGIKNEQNYQESLTNSISNKKVYYLTTNDYKDGSRDVLIYILDHEKLTNKIYGENNYYIGTIYTSKINQQDKSLEKINEIPNIIKFSSTKLVDKKELIDTDNQLSIIKVHNIIHRNILLEQGKEYGGTFLSLISGKEFVMSFKAE
jgi:hypothetical protein